MSPDECPEQSRRGLQEPAASRGAAAEQLAAELTGGGEEEERRAGLERDEGPRPARAGPHGTGPAQPSRSPDRA